MLPVGSDVIVRERSNYHKSVSRMEVVKDW